MHTQGFQDQIVIFTRGLQGQNEATDLKGNADREAADIVEAMNVRSLDRHIRIEICSSPRAHCVVLATALLARLTTALLEIGGTITSAHFHTEYFLAANSGSRLRNGGAEDALRIITRSAANLIVIVTHSVPFSELVSYYLTNILGQKHNADLLTKTLKGYAVVRIDKKNQQAIPLVPLQLQKR